MLDAPRPLVARVLGALATGALLALWAGFAPSSVGGDFSYAVVRGDSMRPHLHNGDIVVLRREDRYGIGDVVAYRDPRIGPLLHRIVGKDGERFVLRGDNRENSDPYAPLPADVMGREAGVWPRGLPIVLALTSWQLLVPVAIAFVVSAIAWQSLRTPPARPRRRFPLRQRRAQAEGR